ncbi:MAG: DUF421 domain-containing protein [Eubacteriales bacterium]|nr:DUF421 domain-containing protein [Eubacteriales bacterium]
MTLLFLRTILLYFAVVFGLRLSGKRQLGELSTSEFAVTILVSELASIPLQDVAVPLFNGIIPLLTLVCLEVLLATLCRKSSRARRVLCGNPCIIVKNGKIDQKMIKNLRLSIEDVMEALRLAGAPNLPDIRYAIVETNGQLSVILKAEAQPVIPSQIHVHPHEVGVPLILISNGTVIQKNLLELGKTENWLLEQCKRQHCSSFDEVFLFTLDDAGNQFIQAVQKGV